MAITYHIIKKSGINLVVGMWSVEGKPGIGIRDLTKT